MRARRAYTFDAAFFLCLRIFNDVNYKKKISNIRPKLVIHLFAQSTYIFLISEIPFEIFSGNLVDIYDVATGLFQSTIFFQFMTSGPLGVSLVIFRVYFSIKQ